MNWHKDIPPKFLHEKFGIYSGSWMPEMDRYWSSDEGFNVMSREFKCELGKFQHITIERSDGQPVGWSDKQQIKDELFGRDRIAIEVYPDRKHLVDVMNVYHLWLLPKKAVMPFGIHPTRDNIGEPIYRGYDFDLQDCIERVKNEPSKTSLEEKVSNSLSDEALQIMAKEVMNFGTEK